MNKKSTPTQEPPIQEDRATAFAEDVISGKIIAGPHVRAACRRHIHDLETAEERGYYFDEYEASEGIAFFEECLCLNGGQFEGKPFLLFPWEDFVIGSIFGWKAIPKDATRTKRKLKQGEHNNPYIWISNTNTSEEIKPLRRFHIVFILTGKGSGKSPICAGVGIKGLVADDEERAEIYAAATFRDQAMVLFRDACAFYDQSPMLQDRLIASGVGEKRWNLAYLATNSFFRVIASDTKKGKSGPRPHMALLDEIHEHPDGTIIEMLRAGFKFRRNPLSFMITNAGHDVTSVCWEYNEMGMKIAEETIINDEFFAFICALDPEDFVNEQGEEDDHYLYDETLWPKVNPSIEYGIPGYAYIRSQVKEAQGLPSKMSTVKRLCFCVWTESESPAINDVVWKACSDKDFPDGLLKGRKCFGGLDLSAVNDLTSLALMFEPGYTNFEKIDGVWQQVEKPVYDKFWRLKVFFWIPLQGLQRKVEVDHVPYDNWKNNKYVLTSNGAAISKSQVVKFIHESFWLDNLFGIAYDRSRMKDLEEFATKEGIELNIGKWDKEKKKWEFPKAFGIKMMPFGQEARSMAPAIDKFEYLLIEKMFRHDGNPCLTWNASNAVFKEDEDGYRKVSKQKSIGRVDGITATVMACGILEDNKETSVYDGLTKEQIKNMIMGKG